MHSLSLSLSAVLLLGGCGSAGVLAPGNDETDRIAGVVSDAIAWPRQESAMGYARAAAATTAARDGRLTVVEVTELEPGKPTEPIGELMFLVHVEGTTDGWFGTEDPVTACYRTEFGFYGVVGSPRRVRCPDDPSAVPIPALPTAPPRIEIPDDADRVLHAQLSRLAPGPDTRRLEADLLAALSVDAGAQPPDVDVAADGTDVGVSVRGDDGCLLGARTAGKVQVWRPSAVQMQPGELTCDADTALAGGGQDPPH